MKKGFLLSSLLALSIIGCSTPMINRTQDFSDLEKEYKYFSTKALSDAYVLRMFNKFLTTGTANPTQIIRQLEFARYLKDVKTDTSYFISLKNIIAVDNEIFTKIDNTSGVPQKKSAEPATFGVFVDSLNPVQPPGMLSTDTITSSGFTANWGALTGATSYDVVVDGGTAVSVTIGTSYTVAGLSSGTSHTWKVRANKGSLSGVYTSNQNVTTSTVPENFKLVEKGTFNMGMTGITEPVHTVTFTKDLYIGEKEVTQGEWASAYDFAVDYDAAHSTTYHTLMSSRGREPSYFPVGGYNANLPVEMVTWWNAIAYCNVKSIAAGLNVAYDATTGSPTSGALLNGTGVGGAIGSVTTDTTQVTGYRLPTEAEWEFAARGGNSSLGYTYSGSNTVGNVAWYSGNSGGTTHEVGTVPFTDPRTSSANELGLYDMSGNVQEWVQDYYASPYSSAAVTNPYISSGGTNRILRGSSWASNASAHRPACRYESVPDGTWRNIGFRVCRTVN